MAASHDTPLVVTHEGGARFAIRIRSHTVIVDQPTSGGGEDAGPMPLELLGAALGSCVALYVQRFCGARGISTGELRVEVKTENAVRPNRVTRFVVNVVLPSGFPAEYVAVVERVARSCPAHNTLARGAAVDVEIGQASAPIGEAFVDS